MAKKNKPPDTAPTASLTHNPFASLARGGAQPANEEPAAAALAPSPASAPTPVPSPASAAHKPAPTASAAKGKRGRLVLRRETKHRGGKAVVVIAGFAALEQFDARATQELAQELKRQLGCGGTVEERGREREIVLQGDRAAKVAELLRERGFRVDGVTS